MAPLLNGLQAEKEAVMLKLKWLPHWQAYSVRLNGRVIGMVRCAVPLPFRQAVEFAY